MTDQDDNGDPLLVRPYILGEPGVPAPRASTETWPESAVEPAPADADPAPTVVIDRPADPAPPTPRRRRMLLAAALVLVLAGAAGLVLALRPEPSAPRALPANRPLPSIAVSGPAPSSVAPPTTASPTAARTRTTGNPAAHQATTTRRASPPTSPTGSRPPPPAPSPAATLSPVPESARVATIGADGGLCLDVEGGLPFDGTSVQVFDCNNSAAQMWTLATDGTLRVFGMCAQAAADRTVHITYCDGRAATQWRAGGDESLVNVAADACLTGDTRSGVVARVSGCTGASNQRWDLP
jgi:hypothetical protein